MRKFVLAACIFALTQPARAQEKQVPVKWEYAELVYRTTLSRLGGKDADGNPVEATSTLTIRWASKASEFSVKGWDEKEIE